jgi:prepilin-type N-terminal cleavage/methylation domain-containing protein
MTFKQNQAVRAGFTLVELLVVMAFAGLMLGLASYGYVSNMNKARSNGFIEALAQDINQARSSAMAKSVRTQILFTSANAYTISNLDTNGVAIVPAIVSNSNATVTMSGVNAGDKIICQSTGFCFAYTSAGALKTIDHIDFTANGSTRTLTITVLGLTRVES